MIGHFPISEFAKMCGTSRDTILYYDKIDLLKPSFKDKNSYRYYSFSQYETYLLIDSLKQSKIPLKKIKTLLKDKTPDYLYSIIDETEKKLNIKIKELTERRDVLKYEKTEIKIALKNIGKFIVKEFPQKPIAVLEKKVTSYETYSKALIALNKIIKQNNLIATYPVGNYGSFSDIKYDKNGTINTYDGTYSTLISPGKGSKTIKKGKYLVTYVFTDFIHEDNIIKSVKEYSKANNLELGDIYYQESLSGVLFNEEHPVFLSKYAFPLK
ncbi:MAG: MerR family transcriptional regulator [Sphaerochaetaceae bacterium]